MTSLWSILMTTHHHTHHRHRHRHRQLSTLSRSWSSASSSSSSSSLSLFLCVLLHILSCQQALGRISYFFSTEARGGINGLSVDSMRAGQANPLPNNSLSSLDRQIAELSYDQYSEHLLAREFRPERVIYTPVCRNPNIKPSIVFNASTTFPIVNTEYRGSTSDCLECKAGPFALFDNKIYFILTGEFGLAPLTKSVVQLRVLQACDECKLNLDNVVDLKVFKTPFLFNCSRTVAEVFSQSMMMYTQIHLKAGRGLKIIKWEQGLQFFFQVFVSRKIGRKRMFADLMLYRATDSGNVVLLHTETVDAQYAQWNIHAMASVDYKQGLLCWTGADRLYCGDIDEHWALSNIHRLLYPGEGVALEICKGNTPELLVFITGVAIAEALDVWNKRVVFFGCYPQWESLGGTGMIKVRPDGKDKQVFPVYRQNGLSPVYSGSMFVLNDPLGECHPPGKLEICLDPPVWINKPGSLLKDKPDDMLDQSTVTTPEATVYKMDGGQVDSESQNSPDPEIIVVDSVKSIDEFEKDKSIGNGNAPRNIYLEIVTIIMLIANMILP